MNKSKCRHEGCNCETDGQAYCSSACETSSKSGTQQRGEGCGCGHGNCSSGQQGSMSGKR